MKSPINIIGSGSKLFGEIKKLSLDEFREYRTSEIFENLNVINDNETYIVFSLLDEFQMDLLFSRTKGSFIFVGSCSALYEYPSLYKYSKIKFTQLNTIKKYNDLRFKYILFGDFRYNNKLKGLTYQSNKNELWDYVSAADKHEEIVIPAYVIKGNPTKMSNVASAIESYLPFFSTIIIKYLTNWSYGYSNPQLSKARNNVILGAGLCADAVYKSVKLATVYANSANHNHSRLTSTWRADPVISNKGRHGLSRYYHGVTPTYAIELYKPLLWRLYNIHLPDELWDASTNSYFVPKKVPRPELSINYKLDKFDLGLSKPSQNIFLCLSVIGNLNFINKNIKNINCNVSDDIIFKIGNIDNRDYKKYCEVFFKKSDGVSVFPAIVADDYLVTFRPVMIKSVNINFIDLIKNFAQFSPTGIVEKILVSIYLKFGILVLKPKSWDLYIQLNVENAYKFDNGEISENSELDEIIKRKKFAISRSLADKFGSFKDQFFIKNVISGIHLGYDRKILDEIPKNIYVLDTSLNDRPGQHPTIVSAINSFRIAENAQHSPS